MDAAEEKRRLLQLLEEEEPAGEAPACSDVPDWSITKTQDLTGPEARCLTGTGKKQKKKRRLQFVI